MEKYTLGRTIKSQQNIFQTKTLDKEAPGMIIIIKRRPSNPLINFSHKRHQSQKIFCFSNLSKQKRQSEYRSREKSSKLKRNIKINSHQTQTYNQNKKKQKEKHPKQLQRKRKSLFQNNEKLRNLNLQSPIHQKLGVKKDIRIPKDKNIKTAQIIKKQSQKLQNLAMKLEKLVEYNKKQKIYNTKIRSRKLKKHSKKQFITSQQYIENARTVQEKQLQTIHIRKFQQHIKNKTSQQSALKIQRWFRKLKSPNPIFQIDLHSNMEFTQNPTQNDQYQQQQSLNESTSPFLQQFRHYLKQQHEQVQFQSLQKTKQLFHCQTYDQFPIIEIDKVFITNASQQESFNQKRKEKKLRKESPQPALTYDLNFGQISEFIFEFQNSEPSIQVPEKHPRKKFCQESFISISNTQIPQNFPVLFKSFQNSYQLKEVNSSIQYLELFLNSLQLFLRPFQTNILDQINSPVLINPLIKLDILQNTKIEGILKQRKFDQILSFQLQKKFKAEYSPNSLISESIYIQMLLDCVNQALNYIRPHKLQGFPQP